MFQQSDNQPDSSFNEQRFAAGCGKIWTMQYILLYAISKGLLCIPIAMMARQSVFLGGKHIHKLFKIPTENNLSTHQKAEIAITRLLHDPKRLAIVLKLNFLFFDEVGQLSSEMINVLDIIFRRIRETNILLGGVVII